MTSTATTPDFVEVQLTAAGITMAAPGTILRIANGHFSYLFTVGTPVRVLSSEWRRTLSILTYKGAPVLAIVAAATPAPAAQKTTTARVTSPAASHTDAPAATTTTTATSPASSEVK